MIRARVVTNQNRLLQVDERMQQRARVKVGVAARVAAGVVNTQGGNVADASPTPVRGTHEGYRAGVRANWLVSIYDKGSLGKRRGALKRNRRKDRWSVTRRGTTFEADRNPDVFTDAGKGVAPRNILGPARLAGRRILNAALRN